MSQQLQDYTKDELIALVRELQHQTSGYHQESLQREISSQGSYVEGDVSVDNGDFVGRDHYRDKHIGLNGNDVNQLIETLLKFFPRNELQNPDRLENTLQGYLKLHNALYEWKELHNSLDKIMASFNPYRALIDDANAKHSLPTLNELQNKWYPVDEDVSVLLDWAQKIEHIGVKYEEAPDGTRGEKWSVELGKLCYDIRIQLGFDSKNIASIRSIPSAFPNSAIRSLYRFLYIEPNWWRELRELTQSFNHKVISHMHLTDKRLLVTATDLYNLSRTSRGS